MALIDLYDRGWMINPTGAAYIQDDQSYSFDEVGQLSCRIANRLLALGLAKETKGAIWAANDVKAWTCTLGLWRANMTWLPVNARNSVEDNHHILDSFDCEVMFYQSEFVEVITALQPRLPKVRYWICIDADTGDACSLDAWLMDVDSKRPNVAYIMDDVVMLSPTGGTTGKPKGVLNTHRSCKTFVAHYMLACRYGAGERPVNLAAAPMTHTAGLLSMPCTAQGGTVVVVTRPDPALIFEAVAKHRVTEFFLPPTVIYKILDIPGVERIDMSSVRYLMYGAAPMSVEKLKKAIDLWGPIMAGGYGQTEAPASISNLPPDHHMIDGELAPDERLSSVGRPNPMIRVETMNDANEILPRGETGEICVRPRCQDSCRVF